MNLREFELLQQKHERSGLSEAVFCKENDICYAPNYDHTHSQITHRAIFTNSVGFPN